MKSEIIDNVINAFLESGFDVEVERLTAYKKELESDDYVIRLQAAENIISFCHTKAWGDLAVAGKCNNYLTLKEWSNALTKLSKYAKKTKLSHPQMDKS